MPLCAEIEYVNSNGEGVHSDICNKDDVPDKEYAELLHECLEEWIQKASGSGGFYVKKCGHKF